MLATSEHFQYYFKTSLLFCFLFIILPIVQPLSFNIPNFNDTESANLIGTAGVAKIENGTIVLNPLIENGVGRAIYGQPLHLKNSSNGNVTDFSSLFLFSPLWLIGNKPTSPIAQVIVIDISHIAQCSVTVSELLLTRGHLWLWGRPTDTNLNFYVTLGSVSSFNPFACNCKQLQSVCSMKKVDPCLYQGLVITSIQ